ncbi:MAG: hypothetical protein OHK93_001291 [Ramalina farinacea]|uniref:Uncharacterized protein n=1 Tax=Ramalina farinacea TaxID=258253 RepID=A0AA43QS14_9LECA|nr:hypothetical protein [Ramalina farinacea]
MNKADQKENQLGSGEKCELSSDNPGPSPGSILQEIHNSAQRRKTCSRRQGLGGLFQDGSDKNFPDPADLNHTSWYNETSNNCSPSTISSPNPTMPKLREVSGNKQRPFTKQSSGREANPSEHPCVSDEMYRYIEYIEQELALASKRNDSDASPSVRKKQSAKMRALAVENKNLKLELDEWHKKYEMRVQEEVDKREEVESQMKDRLIALENEIDTKDAKSADLEWNVECMKVKIKDAEDLHRANTELHARVDLLTNLLVQSPTRPDIRSAAASPEKKRGTHQTPRPRSMLVRIPTSPLVSRPPLSTVSETIFGQPQRASTSPGLFASPNDEESFSTSSEVLHSPSRTIPLTSPTTIERMRRSSNFESRSRASSFMRSTPSSASRPTSFMSSSSGGTPWGVPVLPEDDGETGFEGKRRKMRRFASGSKSLKPLVLPTATNRYSLPVSAPVYPSIETAAGRDFSHSSMDPTKAFLSRLQSDSPYSTPTQQPRRRSIMESANNQALRALEGNFEPPAGSDEKECDASPSSQAALLHCSPAESYGSDKRTPRSRPRSLQKELEEAELAHLTEAHGDPFGDEPTSAGKNVMPNASKVVIGVEPPSSKGTASQPSQTEEDLQPQKSMGSRKAISRHGGPGDGPASNGATSAAEYEAHGLFIRLRNLLCQMKEDPFILAQRLLHHAWCLSNNRLLGGIAWWLLGPIYHGHRRNHEADEAADNSTSSRPTSTCQVSTPDFDWPDFSAEASRRRVAERYVQGVEQKSGSSPYSHGTAPGLSYSLPNATSEVHRTARSFPCQGCVEPSSRRTLRLWLRFSLTIVLAVGMAIKHGPGALLADLPATASSPAEPLSDTHPDSSDEHNDELQLTTAVPLQVRDISGRSSKTVSSVADSGYDSMVVAESLGARDSKKAS